MLRFLVLFYQVCAYVCKTPGLYFVIIHICNDLKRVVLKTFKSFQMINWAIVSNSQTWSAYIWISPYEHDEDVQWPDVIHLGIQLNPIIELDLIELGVSYQLSDYLHCSTQWNFCLYGFTGTYNFSCPKASEPNEYLQKVKKQDKIWSQLSMQSKIINYKLQKSTEKLQ